MSDPIQQPIPEQERSVTYSLEWADVIAFAEQASLHERTAKKKGPPETSLSVWIAFGIIILIVIGAMLVNASEYPVVAAAAYAAISGTIGTFVMVAVIQSMRRAELLRAEAFKLKEMKASLHTVTLSPRGIEQSRAHFRSFRDWKGLEAVLEGRDHLFLYIGSLEGIPIPKRAFQNAEACSEFVALARQYHKAAAVEGSNPLLAP